jgi:hypothetical protein
MTSQDTASPGKGWAGRLVALPVWVIWVIVLIGLYSHWRHGTDGIAGVLMGLYMILYLMTAVRKWDPEKLSPKRRFIMKHRTALMIASLFVMIGGALDMYGLL